MGVRPVIIYLSGDKIPVGCRPEVVLRERAFVMFSFATFHIDHRGFKRFRRLVRARRKKCRN